MIQNPILPGFHPDPSICRVGSDYYIATSTFEWYPGVRIYHSKDLANWRFVSAPLSRATQLDMRGNPDSCGVWAPCLSYADNQFWLVYTDVKRYDGNFKDAHNYIVTAPTIEGPWTDRSYVNSSGFDPSLFHDSDGKKWFYNMVWNHRAKGLGQSPLHSPFGGILAQQYSAEAQALVGEPTLVYTGTSLGLVEAPHVFKKGDYYYLTVAEGGTGYEHAVSYARSLSPLGPFETHPDKHVLRAIDNSQGQLQRVGHGQYVETPDGECFHTYLCGRPLPSVKRCPLGRETGIQSVYWGDDGWLYSSSGSMQPSNELATPVATTETEADKNVLTANTNQASHYDFNSGQLHSDFQWLRSPYPERLFSLTERPGHLRLFGRESVGSWFEQALVARRQQHHNYLAETSLRFSPTTFQQSAGLIAYYNRHKFHYLQITYDETLGTVLNILSCNGDYPESALSFALDEPIAIGSAETIHLSCVVHEHQLKFAYKIDDVWHSVGPTLDASVLSDEGGRGEHASFTGAFVGMMAFDTSGMAMPADFAGFSYEPGQHQSLFKGV